MTRMRTAEFTGGVLDGAVRQLPAHVDSAVTGRCGGQSFYVLDDDTGTFVFTGFNQQGATMAGIVRQSRDAARLEAEAIERDAVDEALRPRGCPRCGLVFGSAAAFTVAHDPNWPGGCLPPGAAGQLAEVDGVWVLPWSDAARR